MDGYVLVRDNGTCEAAFAGEVIADGLTEAEARALVLARADGRPLWRVVQDGRKTPLG